MLTVVVEPKLKVTGLVAAIVKSGEVELTNVNVVLALCLIPAEVPTMVTGYVRAAIELHESVARPEPFGTSVGLIGMHERSIGRGRFERVTVPLKPAMEFTIMVDIS